MKPRSILVLVIVGMILAAILITRKDRPHSGNETSPTNAAAFHSTDIDTASGAGQTNLQTFHPVAHPTAYSTNNVFDETRTQEPGYADRVKRTMAIRHYMHSPAKETPECQQIVEMLAKEGVGLYAVCDVYNEAWNAKSRQQMIDQASAANKERGEVMKEFYRLQTEKSLGAKYGITNQAFFDTLQSIKPKVFFGMRNMAPPTGEVLAE